MADGRAAQAAVELVGLTPYHRRLTLLCGIANAVDAVEILSVGFVVPLVDADFRLSGGEKGALTGVIFLGMLLGSWVFGSLADNFGRRKMLM
jgi:MFS family permease